MKLDVNGNLFARKYVVQNSTDGGPNNGIFLWDVGDSNWGIYMGQSGVNKSLSNGIATAGGGFSSHAIRFRSSSSASQGFIFENSSEENLFSIRANNGRATFRGGVLFNCIGCGSSTLIDGDGSSNWGDLTIQGRVISTNSNLHLSPPSGFDVVINDDYRAARGVATGEAGLQVEGTVYGKMKHISYHTFNNATWSGNPANKVFYFPAPGGDGSDEGYVNGTNGLNNDFKREFVAPYNGKITKIIVRVGGNSGSNPEVRAHIALSRNGSYNRVTSTTGEGNENVNFILNATINNVFNQGDRLGVGFDLNCANCYCEDTDYFVTIVWEYDIRN